jgi:polyisoprenoid-binding protein YceI
MTQPPDLDLTPQPPRTGGVPRWAKWTVGGLIVAVALFFGAIFLYAKVLNDSPDEFGEADIDARLEAEAADDTTPTAPEPTAPDVTVETANPPVASSATTAPAVSTTVVTTVAAAAGDESTWVATGQSEVGYRVKEILFGVDTTAVGRSSSVTGTLTIDGTTVTSTDFSVDVATITSDESRRDNQFRGRIMSADEFPTASFTLTEPIELGVDVADGAAVTTTATGELTLRGAARPVTFEVTAKMENGLIGVQGSIPVVFADYGIANPSSGGITTEDNGLVEFVLVFEPA